MKDAPMGESTILDTEQMFWYYNLLSLTSHSCTNYQHSYNSDFFQIVQNGTIFVDMLVCVVTELKSPNLCTFLTRVSFQACNALYITCHDVILKFLDASFMHFMLASSKVQNTSSSEEHLCSSSLGVRFAVLLVNKVVLQGNDALCHVMCICVQKQWDSKLVLSQSD